ERPGHDRSDLEVVRLHSHAELAGLRVSRHDGVRHRGRMVAVSMALPTPANWRAWLQLATVDVRPLRHREFRLLYIGRLVSLFGSMITFVAVPFQVYALTRCTLMVGHH